jgi:hypothetical protein
LYNSPNWTRTNDLAVNSRSLYQLSYRGQVAEIIAKSTHSPIGVEEIDDESYNMWLSYVLENLEPNYEE